VRADSELKRRVENELNWEPRVNPSEIGVAVKDGIVTLTGYVDSWPAKRAAEEAVKRVLEVVGVAEEIKVRLPGTDERKDVDLARAAANALNWNTWVPRDAVKAIVQEGWIRLEGEVPSEYQRAAAEGAVRFLTGIKGVTNLIAIRPRLKPLNVREAIQEAFQRHARLDALRIGVNVHGDTVTLHGNVPTWNERSEAESAAWRAPGVSNVENQLTVGP
jgi:osmotically-inducible protein OsmY